MELKLYQRLKGELLNQLAAASERHDPAYQHAVERYAPEPESGIKKWGRDAIQGWLDQYNRLMSKPVRLRYYQILALYFTEGVLRAERDRAAPLLLAPDASRYNMLAYWMATGSGKTLLMHFNILQYIAHIGGLRAFDELQIVLTTPGVNLIEQHRRELTPVIDALNRQCANRIKLTVESTGSLLNHERGYFDLPPSSRVFRLVLVDEGHIGLAGGGKEAGAFKSLRHQLADYPNAFLFEYSATYHGIADKHVDEYEEQIVYDYNYYRFFKDGYGKDYDIRQISTDQIAGDAECWDNFMAAFTTLSDKLSLHNELRITEQEGLGFAASFSDRPLIAFMGNTVEDSKKEGSAGDEVSDIRKLLAFLAKLPAKDRARLKPVFNTEASGHLTLTRCPAVRDEIYLSWGDEAYWGIVNVGNGDKFFNDSENHPEFKDQHGQALVQLRKRPIVERYFQFAEIDSTHSPINVLIGSRKFAEGWNCYRVSVIGLINLGTSKGNKIIQIYGRGVRLKGLQGDGKRKHLEHNHDYSQLLELDTPDNRMRSLETLNVFSLRPTYLKKFLDALEGEIPRWFVERSVKVETQTLALGKKKETFAEYAPKLNIFKVGREDTEPRLLAARGADGVWHWRYLTNDGETSEHLAKLEIKLDFRPDAESACHNLAQNVREWLDAEARYFLPQGWLEDRLSSLLNARKMQLLWTDSVETPRYAKVGDLLSCVSELNYHREFADLGFPQREKLLEQALMETVSRLHHRLIYDLNKRHYRIDEQLAQGSQGDIIDRYSVRVEFDSEAKLKDFESKYPSPNLPAQLSLDLEQSQHVYGPLFRNQDDKGVQSLKLQSMSISPDALNVGERKFVEDMHGFINKDSNQGRLQKWQFYLMRNVESLRSVGVYLDSETRAYFPDFVLWVVGEKKTHILLIDPKGQSGIQDWDSLTGGVNAKVQLAHSGHLQELAQQLQKQHGRPFKVDSFILLRKSSPLGRANGNSYNLKTVAEMERHHVLHLNWVSEIDGKRLDEVGDMLPPPPDNKCYVERVLRLAGVLS